MNDPIPMLLFCPMCNTRHIDDDKFATKPHHTHACQNMQCGMVWRPAIVPTVGVWFLPGFNNSINKLDAWKDQQLAIPPPRPAASVMALHGVYVEIAAERAAQVKQWGGADHDDEHEPHDWFDFIRKQLGREKTSTVALRRIALIKIGALAVAAVESYDRKAK